MSRKRVVIIGAGLAGCEAAWQLASHGLPVRLFEMKPAKRSPAHRLDGFAELVCSNSLRSNDPANAAGLLKEEMKALGSLVIEAAEKTAVPAGKALAVDRNLFSEYITRKIEDHPLIEIVREEIKSLSLILDASNEGPVVVATGPLTSDALSERLSELTGKNHLYFYDSVAPIVESSSIDFEMGFRASRYGYGGDDYFNFPLDRELYERFLIGLIEAKKAPLKRFEEARFFEGCLPIELMAQRGPGTLRYGPMKPFGLRDPKTGREPYAVVQLRQDDSSRSMYNMVGFQTRLTWPEQRRVFRLIPGLSRAKFLRYGVVHRNTYINSPELLDIYMEFKDRAGLFFAGQITGVEGYIESAASGLWVGLHIARRLLCRNSVPPPTTTCIGSLIWHVANPRHRNFQPMNVNFGLMPIIKGKIPKDERKIAMIERSRSDFASWAAFLRAP